MSSNDTPNTDPELEKDLAQMQEQEGDTVSRNDENNDDGSGQDDTDTTDAPDESGDQPQAGEDEEEDNDDKPDDDGGGNGEEDDDTDDDDEEDDEPKSSRKRPERYIPIAKYKDEKNKWREEKQELFDRIEKLESATKDTQAGSEKETKAIEAYAEKHNMSVDDAKEALDTAKELLLPKDIQDKLGKLGEVTEERERERQDQEEQQYFEKEYQQFEPTLKERYPNATEKQLKEARGLMDQLSHTNKYAALDLDEILDIPGNKKQFDDILDGAKGTKGPENSKTGASDASSVKASDFKKSKDGRFNFAKLHAMDEGPEKDKIVSNLDPEAYVSYIDDLEAHSADQGIEVRRQGERVNLK